MKEGFGDNMEKWNLVSKPPNTALRKISGGRLAGKSDINPQWRYKIMTEVYGPCGEGWRWEVVDRWKEEGPEGTVMVFVRVAVYVKKEHEEPYLWSYPITGIGGDFLIMKEKGGLRANDEAYKMATTDALGAALKFLGVASDVYEGRYDRSTTKYSRDMSPASEDLSPIQEEAVSSFVSTSPKSLETTSKSLGNCSKCGDPMGLYHDKNGNPYRQCTGAHEFMKKLTDSDARKQVLSSHDFKRPRKEEA